MTEILIEEEPGSVSSTPIDSCCEEEATVLRRLNEWLDRAGPALENCPDLAH